MGLLSVQAQTGGRGRPFSPVHREGLLMSIWNHISRPAASRKAMNKGKKDRFEALALGKILEEGNV